jgi:hypothetical protein
MLPSVEGMDGVGIMLTWRSVSQESNHSTILHAQLLSDSREIQRTLGHAGENRNRNCKSSAHDASDKSN